MSETQNTTKQPQQDTFFDKVDWNTLRDQKMSLLRLSEDMELPETQKRDIRGIINLIDAIQDHAVHVIGVPETEVFNMEDEE